MIINIYRIEKREFIYWQTDIQMYCTFDVFHIIKEYSDRVSRVRHTDTQRI